MGVKSMSPGANFTTHRRPTAAKNNTEDHVLANDESCTDGHPRHSRSGSGGLFRFLLCTSRPCVLEEEEANRRRHAAADLDDFETPSNGNSGDLNGQLRTELQVKPHSHYIPLSSKLALSASRQQAGHILCNLCTRDALGLFQMGSS